MAGFCTYSPTLCSELDLICRLCRLKKAMDKRWVVQTKLRSCNWRRLQFSEHAGRKGRNSVAADSASDRRSTHVPGKESVDWNAAPFQTFAELQLEVDYRYKNLANCVLRILYVSQVYHKYTCICNVYIWISEEPAVQHLPAHHGTKESGVCLFF